MPYSAAVLERVDVVTGVLLISVASVALNSVSTPAPRSPGVPMIESRIGIAIAFAGLPTSENSRASMRRSPCSDRAASSIGAMTDDCVTSLRLVVVISLAIGWSHFFRLRRLPLRADRIC